MLLHADDGMFYKSAPVVIFFHFLSTNSWQWTPNLLNIFYPLFVAFVLSIKDHKNFCSLTHTHTDKGHFIIFTLQLLFIACALSINNKNWFYCYLPVISHSFFCFIFIFQTFFMHFHTFQYIEKRAGRKIFICFSNRLTDTRHKMRQIYFITISFHFWALSFCLSVVLSRQMIWICTAVLLLLFFVPICIVCANAIRVLNTHTHIHTRAQNTNVLKSSDIILENLHKILKVNDILIVFYLI